jgi:outer membrane protein assembly factor BamA
MFQKSLIILIFLFSFSTFAKTEYSISGNTRTKSDYIQHLISKCHEKGEGSGSELEQCLMNQKIFSKVVVKDNEVSIEERWTLIPIPQISAGSDTSSFGVFVMERNFLGRGKFAILGASVGSDADSYFLFYKDPELFLTDWTAETLVQSSQEDFKSYVGEDVVYSFNESSTGVKLGVGHKFLLDYEFGISGFYFNKKYKDFGGYTLPTDNKNFGVEANLKYVNSDFKFYFNEGFDGELTLIRDLNRSDSLDEVGTALVSLRYQKNIFLQHALQIGLRSNVSDNATVKDVMKMGGRKGLRGIQENGLWAEKMVSVSTDYQVPLIFSSYGVWTVAPFFDYGLVDSEFSPISNYSSYGIGGYLYLKQIAIPGIGIEFGRNEKFQGTFVSFSVGLRP